MGPKERRGQDAQYATFPFKGTELSPHTTSLKRWTITSCARSRFPSALCSSGSRSVRFSDVCVCVCGGGGGQI